MLNRYITAIAVAAMTVIIAVSQPDAAGRRLPKDQIAKDAEITNAYANTHCNVLGIADHPSELVFDSLDWKIPLGDSYRTQLPTSGHVAYVAVDSSLPLISIEAHIRSGSIGDPAGQVGLGSLMARLLRAGGTEAYPADTLDMLIDLLAMRFSFSQGEAHIVFQASFLYEYADTAMSIMQQMFFHPAFEEEKIERERSIMKEAIRHRFANPGPTLSVAYRKHNYPETPVSRLATAASLDSISRDDFVNLHRAAFGSSEMIISASGKFDRDEMIARLDAVFPAQESRREVPIPEIEIVPQVRALIIHRDINQAYIRMGLPLFRRPHDDFYAVSIMNFILGGSGFISRLGTRVRSDEGLTYSIHSSAESNYTYPGTLFVNFHTKTESYPKAISIILEEMEKIINEGVTESELENARSALISELPSMFRSPEDIVSTYAWSEFYGRAPDHYVRYPEELMKLTLDDIKAAARKYIDFGRISYTIVGDTAAISRANAAATGDGFFVLDSLETKKFTVADSLVGMWQ
ncbi:MAG: insulinase family protein [Chitinispirillales bacterium]|jgi:zinc protease|nr:insulinase family protein [Chitinispirillales bacterium]